ncbi:MAG TPA: GNAT family N-acetyltransferase [Candidatus Sulfotelmatobacter sp.]|nr:GNAT family N-acetyltransferase [Candidatus Sulfotelmatobacter sp.]
MPLPTADLQLRPATIDDAALAADLDSLRDPAAPFDPVLVRHWWQTTDATASSMRRIAVRDGAAIAFVSAAHDPWVEGVPRFGQLRPVLRDDVFKASRYEGLLVLAEDWLRSEGARTSLMRLRDDRARELGVADRHGYREARRTRISDLDLEKHRDRILSTAQVCRSEMSGHGVKLSTVASDPDPDVLTKLYRLTLESERDIPSSVPMPVLPFDDWSLLWFGNPCIHEDRCWIAREGDDVVGVSVLDFPITRGIPVTNFTGTARTVRGRGIARALKYQTMAQAIELGFRRVRTYNDGENAPILHINEEMGYEPAHGMIELHRDMA